MAQIVKLRRSSVSGQKPTNSNLQLGELALNTTDGKVFLAVSGSGGPSVQELVSTNTVNTGSIYLTDNVTASFFTGSFIGNASGLTNVPFVITGSDVDGNNYDKQFSKLHFDSDTGLNVSESAPGTAFISIGSHFRDIFVSGSGMLRATGSDAFEITSDGGLVITAQNTDTNYNGYTKELNFSVANLSSSLNTRMDVITGSFNSFTSSVNQHILEIDNFTSSVVLTNQTSSMTVLSASYALTAAFALNAGAGGGAGAALGVYATLNQTSAATTWSFEHNIGQRYPIFQVFDTNGNVVIPTQIRTIDENNAEIIFGSAQSGKVIASLGGGNGTTQEFTNSNLWTVDHNLGTDYPDVTVWDNNKTIIIPNKIESITNNQIKIYFSVPVTGHVSVSRGGHIVSGSVTWEGLSGKPSGLVSSSNQLTGAYDARYVLSGSITQTTWDNIANKPAGIVSGSIQVDITNTTNYTTFSSSISSSIAALSASIASTNLSDDNRLDALENTTSSLNSYTSSNTSNINAIHTATSSLNTFTSSANGRLNSLETESGSIRSDFNTFTSSYITVSGSLDSRLDVLEAYSSSQLVPSASMSFRTLQTDVYCKNVTGVQINKGTVVRITGAVGDNPLIAPASLLTEGSSANTLGITTQDIPNDDFGLVITEGVLIGVNTSGMTAGDLLYLGSNGTFTTTPPVAPNHGVRLGEVLRVQQNNGSIYVRIDNGMELNEAHDVIYTGITTGDLLIRSGSVWKNGKTLNGDYTVTGSLTITQNLVVLGSSSITYVTASQLNVSSSTISVNVFEPAERFGGLKVYDSGSSNATASLLWDSEHNHWVYQNVSGSNYTGGMLLSGPRNSGSLGDEPGLINGRIVKSIGGDHLDVSIISETGTTVTVAGDLVANSFTGTVEYSSIVNKPTLVSGSSQISITGTTEYSTFSSSIATTTNDLDGRLDSVESKTGSYATTGSNTFIGNQVITGTSKQTFNEPGNNQEVQVIKVNSFTDSQTHVMTNNTFGWYHNDTEGHEGFASQLFTSDYHYGSAYFHDPEKWEYLLFPSGAGYDTNKFGLYDNGDTTSKFVVISDRLELTGSVNITGSLTLNGNPIGTGKLDSTEFYTYTSSVNPRLTSIESATASLQSKTGSYATTGSNSFIGNENINGNLSVTGSVVISGSLDISNANVGSSRYLHTQGSTSTTWSITHNLGYSYPNVTVYDGSNNKVMLPSDVTSIDQNTTQVTFATPEYGYALVSVGGVTTATADRYLHTVSSATGSWVINHNFNYKYVNIDVYDNNDEQLIPQKVTAVSANTVQVDFATPTSGNAIITTGGPRSTSIFNQTGSFYNTNYNIGVTGSLVVTGDVDASNFNTTSDEKLKTNLERITGALDKIEKLNGYTFDWLESYSDDKTRQIGMLANEVHAVQPELTSERNILLNGEEERIFLLDYSKVTALLIEAVKELNDKVKNLENKK